MTDTHVRTGQAEFPLSKDDFVERYRARFTDPAFADKQNEIEQFLEVAWDDYRKARNSPITRAGAEFADPGYDLSVDWLATRDAVRIAHQSHDDASRPVACY
jgi:hypothetical protein